MRDMTGGVVRFGQFEFDLEREQLRSAGRLIRLSPQPARLLGLLLRRAGDVVTREEIREHLWRDGTWVEFEQGINHCIRRIRTALGDDAGAARFVETLPRVGYRFAGRVEVAGAPAQPPASGAEPGRVAPPAHTSPWRRWRPFVALAGAAGLVAIFALGLARSGPAQARPGQPFERMRIDRLTARGSLTATAISPDGAYLAYALAEDGGFAVRLKVLGADREMRIVEPVPTAIVAVDFSPDGSHVYFVRRATAGPGYSSLYRVATLGGAATELIDDVDSGVGFSPDGSRLAFVRGIPSRRASALISAAPDGSDEETIAEWEAPELLVPVAPAWSPDGGSVAVVVLSTWAGSPARLVGVRLDGADRHDLGETRWNAVAGLTWLSASGGLLLAAEEPGPEDRAQIWRLDSGATGALRISNDLSSYRGLSKTADDRAIVTLQVERSAAVWSIDPNAADGADAAAERWTRTYPPSEALLAVRRGPDGGVIFSVRKNGRIGLWRVLRPGGAPEPLFPRAAPHVQRFTVSPDGETVAYQSVGDDGLPHLWTIPARGGTPVRWTSGGGEVAPTICGRSGTLAFTRRDVPGIWSVASPLAEPVQVSPDVAFGPPVCSPDGTRIAVEVSPAGPDEPERKLAIIPVEGREPTHRLPWPGDQLVAWAPDGTGVMSFRPLSPISQVWLTPLESGDPRPLAVAPGVTFSCDWSVDGNRLLCVNGTVSHDAVRMSQAG